MSSPDITDLDILIDDLLLDAKPPEPTGVSIDLLPTYPDDETQHLYSLKIPMSLWHRLKFHVGEGGNKAKFVRQAIYEKLARATATLEGTIVDPDRPTHGPPH